MARERPIQEREAGRPFRLGRVLLVIIGSYLAVVFFLLERYRRSGTQVGLTSEIYLFQKGSIQDWMGREVLRPWTFVLGQPVYWYELKLPDQPGQQVRLTYIPE